MWRRLLMLMQLTCSRCRGTSRGGGRGGLDRGRGGCRSPISSALRGNFEGCRLSSGPPRPSRRPPVDGCAACATACGSRMTRARTSRGSRALLEAAYDDLGFSKGALLSPSQSPSAVGGAAWQSLGEWLMLGSRVGADRIFFVGDDPVVVFTELPRGAGELEVVAAYKRAWSLGRARCLFLASESELRVYALTSPPPRGPEDARELTPLDVVERSADVVEMLASYHRERVESGALFEETPFRLDGRADDLLLHDVASATEALVGSGLPRRVAHGLIERVILIRYMEDREIVVPTYVHEIANRDSGWQARISSESLMPTYGTESAFVRCLGDRELTYAVFAALAEDFNGDMFTVPDVESELVSENHLRLIQRLLTGGGFTAQEPLFLWAYDFSVVPVGLISSMYEQFYRTTSNDQSSTHYTPQELVEYVTSQVLTDECLTSSPRACDPACGSGIFLVEAYRRMVRHEMAERQKRLSTSRLRHLLLTRISGVDINSEAIRLAAPLASILHFLATSPRVTSAEQDRYQD